jgi:hypothetical protein
MKALISAGIDEATLRVGHRLTWEGADWGRRNDVVAEIQRDDAGTIIGIGFGSWLRVFTPRMKLAVVAPDEDFAGNWEQDTRQIGYWWMRMRNEYQSD